MIHINLSKAFWITSHIINHSSLGLFSPSIHVLIDHILSLSTSFVKPISNCTCNLLDLLSCIIVLSLSFIHCSLHFRSWWSICVWLERWWTSTVLSTWSIEHFGSHSSCFWGWHISNALEEWWCVACFWIWKQWLSCFDSSLHWLHDWFHRALNLFSSKLKRLNECNLW